MMTRKYDDKRTIGILGGMGPEATARMFELIIKATAAEKDQDHPKVIIYSNPEVPPRTDAIFRSGPSPVPLLIEGFQALKRAGAHFMVMPCITAHHFLNEVRHAIDFDLINLVDETRDCICGLEPAVHKVGILASTGTIQGEIFDNVFERAKLEIVRPNKKIQKTVMKAIFGPKGLKAGFVHGETKALLVDAAGELIQKGAEVIVGGCTEIPLALHGEDLPVPFIDPMQCAAVAAVRRAGYPVRGKE
jgi:aspartate racemase